MILDRFSDGDVPYLLQALSPTFVMLFLDQVCPTRVASATRWAHDAILLAFAVADADVAAGLRALWRAWDSKAET